MLARKGGWVSFIVSDAWLNSQYFSNLRNHLLSEQRIDLIAVFDYPVFEQATMENSVFVPSVSESPGVIRIQRLSNPNSYAIVNQVTPTNAIKRGMIDPRQSVGAEKIIEKIEQNSRHLDEYVRLNRGIHAYRTDGYGRSKFGAGPQTKKDKETESYHANRTLNKTYLPELKGKDVFRFTYVPTGRFISYGPWLAEPRDPGFFHKPKLAL